MKLSVLIQLHSATLQCLALSDSTLGNQVVTTLKIGARKLLKSLGGYNPYVTWAKVGY